MSSRTEVPGLCAGSLPSTRSSQETQTHPSSHRGRKGSRSPGVEVGRAGAAWALGAGLGQVALLWGARRKRRTGRAGAGPGAQVGGETVTSDRLGRLGVSQVSRLGGDRTRPATGPSESR